MSENQSQFPYLHGFSAEEQDRLRRQAAFGEHIVYQNVDFSRSKKLLEVGCGVGAQSEILLRRFPKVHLTGIDLNDRQLSAARQMLGEMKHLDGRYQLLSMDASKMDFDSNSFDGAFLCWILEHVPDPSRILSEVRRVLKPGSKIYVTEVMNSSFFLDPYSPNVWKYWMAFNDYQYDGAGDPFIGAKLGNLLSSVGFKRIETDVKIWHFDNRQPEKRKEIMDYWKELLLSAADQLVAAKYTTSEIVAGMKQEMDNVSKDPNSVFFDTFMQASAVVMNLD